MDRVDDGVIRSGRCPMVAVVLVALFFALLVVADLLPTWAERRAGVVAPRH